MLIAQEDHWILTVSGYGAEHHPPTDEDGTSRRSTAKLRKPVAALVAACRPTP